MRAQRGGRTGECKTCAHAEVARINFLLARGAAFAAVARQFGLSEDSVTRHYRNHVPSEFKAQVKLGPFQSEEHLRKLCAEAGTSVLDNLRSIYSGLTSRWLVNYEAGDDATLVMLSRELHTNLVTQARLTRELMPAPSSVVNNFFQLPLFGDLQSRLLTILRDFPEARAAVLREFKSLAEKQPPLIEARADAA